MNPQEPHKNQTINGFNPKRDAKYRDSNIVKISMKEEKRFTIKERIQILFGGKVAIDFRLTIQNDAVKENFGLTEVRGLIKNVYVIN